MSKQATTPKIRVPLTRGKFALIDGADSPMVSGLKWQARHSKGNWYAIHSTVDGEVPMHVLLLGNKHGYEVDHINQDGLDNRRSNLRHSTPSQNRANVSRRSDNKSGYKGVSAYQDKWQASIQSGKVWRYLGRFNTKVEAAVAYNRAAEELFGEFAWLNKIH